MLIHYLSKLQVLSPTRLRNIEHADAFKTFIGWIVLARAQHVHYTVLFVRRIQRYLLLTSSGNGQISLKKNSSKVLLTTSTLLNQITTRHILRLILYFQSHSNVLLPIASLARVESTLNATMDIKEFCVQPALKAFTSDFTLA